MSIHGYSPPNRHTYIWVRRYLTGPEVAAHRRPDLSSLATVASFFCSHTKHDSIAPDRRPGRSMLSQREVIEVKKPVFPLLLYADPGKPYRQRLGQHLKRIDAGTSNVTGSSPYMAARAGGLSRLDAMARAAVAAGDGQWGSVMGQQQLQPVHSRLVHIALAGLTTRHLGKREIGPAACRPVVRGIAHFVTPCKTKFIFESNKDPLPHLHK
jgi:hypothetical protein